MLKAHAIAPSRDRVADFGDRLCLGGDARMVVDWRQREEIFRLPAVPPAPGAALFFRLLLDPADACWAKTDDGSPFVLETSVEVRP